MASTGARVQRLAAPASLQGCQDALTVLAALARTDGVMDDAEVGVMLEYAAEVASAYGLEMSAEDGEKLTGWLRRLRPERDAVTSALDAIASDASAGDLLLRYAARLMDADGVHDAAEFDFAMDMQDRLR